MKSNCSWHLINGSDIRNFICDRLNFAWSTFVSNIAIIALSIAFIFKRSNAGFLSIAAVVSDSFFFFYLLLFFGSFYVECLLFQFFFFCRVFVNHVSDSLRNGCWRQNCCRQETIAYVNYWWVINIQFPYILIFEIHEFNNPLLDHRILSLQGLQTSQRIFKQELFIL